MATKPMKTLTVSGKTYEVTDEYARTEINTIKEAIQGETITSLGDLGITATANEINVLKGVTATTAEINYVDGVTSNIQTQLNTKQATITGAASTVATSNTTANRALVSNASGKIGVSTTTLTELGYLSGVTSNIQTQINAISTATNSSQPNESYMSFVANINSRDALDAAFGKGNESYVRGLGRQLSMYLRFKGDTNTTLQNNIAQYDTLSEVFSRYKADIAANSVLMTLIRGSDYAYNLWSNTKSNMADFVLYSAATGFNSIVGSPNVSDGRITVSTSTSTGFTASTRIGGMEGTFSSSAVYPVNLATLISSGDIYRYKNLKIQITSNARSSANTTLAFSVLGKQLFTVGSVSNGILTTNYSDVIKAIGNSSNITASCTTRATDSNVVYTASCVISKIWLTESD